ncbi:hypothetical protein [Streptomyces sp. DSM 40750]|uniref:hypothetical protein n=1 Tax=Streptomyces sp. DSM 40750 TaxID=2801030 RepID=UPI00214AF711|nr:hypothetical protein [Streptomyces sp. DSM 40750]UUU23532.1 hypothetical protein JIX55_26535 [Streptomyces sp. DSM 40750]
MVTSAHEGLHRIFQERPEILAPVFGVLGLPFPEKATVDALTPDVTETKPLERRVDTVLRIGPSDGDDFLLAIEAQSGRNADKELSWAYYVAHLQSKYRLPVILLVVCQDRATAKWATGPFDCRARGWTAQTTRPLVIGPDNLPEITDTRTAADNLAMAAFSALAHARSPQIDAILETMGHALQVRDGTGTNYFYEFLEVTLRGTPAGDKWEEILSFVTYFPGRGTVRETAYLEGKAEGEAKGLLYVLDVRGIPVPDSVRERIAQCTDLELLDRWLERSRTVTQAEDLFTEDSAAPEDDPDQG